MYIITDGKINKTAETLERAQAIAFQLTAVFGHEFKVKQYNDVWEANDSK